MQVLNIKIDGDLLKEIDGKLKKNRYSTRTEFVREAIRDKLSQLERDKMWEEFEIVRKKNKHKTTDEQIHKTREKLAKELEAELK
ncbi:MAG: ribbon-helix-helix domain-containing protein [Nanoarchaeota archaeon]